MQQDNKEMTPLGAVMRGIVAGAAGTAVLTAYQLVESKIGGSEDGGGEEGPPSWENAPEPAKVGKRIIEGVFKREVSVDQIGLLTNVMHWTYGSAWGAAYGLTRGTWPGRALSGGLAFGTTVWGSDYVLLPAMKLYKPMWKYPPASLAKDWARHLTYGLGVARAYRALEP